jgi:ABC-type antimicrobial peptide transport system permease subunit
MQALMRRFLPDSGGLGPSGWVGVTLIVSVIAFLGGYIPARHAARIEPIDALRR